MLVLVKCCSCTPGRTSREVGGFFYPPHASFIEVCFLNIAYLTHLILVLVKCFSCTPEDTSNDVFFLHTSC